MFVAGIDVGAGGNVFGLTRGLRERFGDRVRDTPISETAIMGLGVGAAMAGMRPVVELMYLDFVGVCLDQLLNQAAKLPFMTGGAAQMALTVRTQFGAGRSSGSQHSQSLEALLAHIPGLTVVMPSTPADTYGLLRAAIQDPNPVVFIENRLLYGMKGPQPPDDYIVPIGKSAVVRPGTDITVVSVSRMVHEAVAAAERVAGEGISVEVIDLRTVAPLDMAPILESVHKTSRLLIAHEAVVPFGIGAEIAATVARDGFWDLDAPIERIGAAATPPPYAPELERAWLPDRDDIADGDPPPRRRVSGVDVLSSRACGRSRRAGSRWCLRRSRAPSRRSRSGRPASRACSRGRRGSARPPTPPRPRARLAFSFAIDASLRNGCPVSRRYAARYVSQRAASSSVAMSASLNCTAWNFEIGWPNCSRSLA